ncbi:MAG: hypothetical protein KJ063_12490 [Anaerolineae bacterium]|nr:hypothetical protein [Anaerolineae bacterium]
MSPITSSPRERIHRLMQAVLLAFTGVALALAYWGVARAPAILARDDNPRLVEAALRIQRGRIYDIHNVLLAETVGEGNRLTRVYPIPSIGPAVGYYSFRHGTSGIEEGLNSTLRGDSTSAWEMNRRQLRHEVQVGRDVRLTLNATWQQQAATLMEPYQGAMVLLALPDAAIRVMVSQPGYDPNLLDQQFAELTADSRAPLLNRVTQGQYQPGMVLQPFFLAAALEQGLLQLSTPAPTLTDSVIVAGQTFACTVPDGIPQNYESALIYACPAPMQRLSMNWSAAALEDILDQFGFTQNPILPLNTDVPFGEPVQNVPLALIGQENLTVTPLQVALALATLTNGGQSLRPQLVSGVQNETGVWQPYLPPTPSSLLPIISAGTARQIMQALPVSRGIIGHDYLVLSGPEGNMNSWYIAAAPLANPRYVLVLVLEGEEDSQVAVAVGQTLLQTILATP